MRIHSPMRAVIQFPDISSEIFSISFWGVDFALRWYALGYIAGILIAWKLGALAVRRATLWPQNKPPMTPEQIEQLMTWIIIGVIAGGRLGFVLFYQPAYYLANPAEILMVWHGGMSFHGGFLGVVIASWIFVARSGIPKLSAADLIAHTVPPGLFLVRIANFINAELWGRPTDLPWGVVFPGAAAQTCAGVSGVCARHPSQLYEAALEGLVLGACLMWMVYRTDALKRPGQVLGAFLAGYGVARFLVEFVRQPDPQFISEGNPLGLAFQINGIGLTMGQSLSLPMIILGLWFIWRAHKAGAASG